MMRWLVAGAWATAAAPAFAQGELLRILARTRDVTLHLFFFFSFFSLKSIINQNCHYYHELLFIKHHQKLLIIYYYISIINHAATTTAPISSPRKIRAVFLENVTDPRLLERIARRTRARCAPGAAGRSCSPETPPESSLR